MSTFASDFLDNFDARWNEVNILIEMANDLEDNNPKFQVICRATIVLIVANFEGFLSEILKCLINDINANHYFYNTSERMKMTYCMQFLSDEKGNDRRVRKLIETFDELDTKYVIEPFLYENNKNPKASVIEKLFSEIGGKNFFGYITECDIEKVFENDSQITSEYISKMKSTLATGTESFPYNISIEDIGFNVEHKPVSKDCLWKVFIDQTLNARHSVAHGISQDNTMSLAEIKETREKIKILELAFAIWVLKIAIKNT